MRKLIVLHNFQEEKKQINFCRRVGGVPNVFAFIFQKQLRLTWWQTAHSAKLEVDWCKLEGWRSIILLLLLHKVSHFLDTLNNFCNNFLCYGVLVRPEYRSECQILQPLSGWGGLLWKGGGGGRAAGRALCRKRVIHPPPSLVRGAIKIQNTKGTKIHLNAWRDRLENSFQQLDQSLHQVNHSQLPWY